MDVHKILTSYTRFSGNLCGNYQIAGEFRFSQHVGPVDQYTRLDTRTAKCTGLQVTGPMAGPR